MSGLTLFIIILICWNLILSILVWKFYGLSRALSCGDKKTNLSKVLKKLQKHSQLSSRELERIRKEIGSLQDQNKLNFQKSSLVKFNPFSELGGDQSFCLALLNGKNQGIVITSLHGRRSTRIYTKLVKDKKDVKLSKEELRAIKQAEKIR